VIETQGEVRLRAPEAVNEKMKTGAVEVMARALTLLNTSKTPPIYIEDGTNEQESLRL
jgi:aspartyl-tRNA synthetase